MKTLKINKKGEFAISRHEPKEILNATGHFSHDRKMIPDGILEIRKGKTTIKKTNMYVNLNQYYIKLV